MKNLYITVIFSLLIINCSSKNDSEDEIISFTKFRDYGIFWNCAYIEANLFGAGKESDREINSKLNDYKPKLLLDFSGAGLCNFMVDRFSAGKYWFLFKDENIIFDIDDNVKLRAKGYIKRNLLYLNFSYLDFDILITILGDDFPYNKGIITNIHGGGVTLVFTTLNY